MTLGNMGEPAEPQILVTTRAAGPLPPAPLTVKTFTFSRDLPLVKHIGLFGQLKLRREAQLSGFDDALFVEADGRISEGATWNLGFVDRDGVVVWPDTPVLPGVTMQLLKDAHGDSTTIPIEVSDLGQMRAAFATNVSVGVRTVKAIDDVQFAIDDPTLDLLRKVYAELPGEPL
jgi:branched-subunit amino acid aminotransferase/4-amino-4-deoxychorismate lyase